MQHLRPKIGLATIASPFEVGADKALDLHRQAIARLTEAGLEVVPAQALVNNENEANRVGLDLLRKEIDAICVLYGTYADDTFATTMIEQSALPAIVWGTNQFDTGSIAGAQQVSEILSEMNRYYKLVFGDVDDVRAIREVVMTSRVGAASRRLRGSRIGVIGYQRIQGQTQAAFDEIELRERIGSRIVGISMYHFRKLMAEVKDEEARRVWQELSRGVNHISVNDEQIMDAARAYLAMKRIVQDSRLDGLAVEDWFELIGIPNLGLSILNEQGIAAGCEADVHSTVTLRLLSLLTGQPAFHGELLGILEEEDALLVAHYGAGAPSLAASRDQIRFEPDRASGKGVSVICQIKPGPVTIASLTGRKGSYRMLIAAGMSVPAREVFHGGIVANVRFRVNHREVLRKARGMSHHWMLGLGDVSSELAEFCEMSRITPVVV